MEFDMVKLRDGLAKVISKSFIAATRGPSYSDFMRGVTEYGTESVVDGHLIGKSRCNFVDPCL